MRQLRNLEKEGPSQATPESGDNQRVCLLTIHAAKGLEAPVVFLADSTGLGGKPPGAQTLVRWPAESDRPSDFMLLGNSRQRDSISTARLELEKQDEQKESANLLYVALTRARNMLVISGCMPSSRQKSLGWYGQIATAVCGETDITEPWIHTFNQPGSVLSGEKPGDTTAIPVDPRLRHTLTASPPWREIAPSHRVQHMDLETTGADGRTRGLAIHRMLQLRTETGNLAHEPATLLNRIAGELHLSTDDPRLTAWWTEVQNLITSGELAWIFTPGSETKAFSEVPIQYRREQQTVYGIIDRLLVTDTEVKVIDYKSHRISDAAQLLSLSEHYKPQMDLYREGVEQLWPNHAVTGYLLFTEGGQLVKID